jgi:hypothetical protein
MIVGDGAAGAAAGLLLMMTGAAAGAAGATMIGWDGAGAAAGAGAGRLAKSFNLRSMSSRRLLSGVGAGGAWTTTGALMTAGAWTSTGCGSCEPSSE